MSDDSHAFFFASTPATGTEPWISDGTESGTRLLEDVYPGLPGVILPRDSSPGAIVAGRFIFRDQYGRVWLSDAAATAVAPVDLGGEQAISEIGTVGDVALVETLGTDDTGLWSVDPHSGDSELLRRFDHVPSEEIQLTTVGALAYFVARDEATGSELWETDGTRRGTRLVRDIFPGTGGSSPTQLVEANGQLFFFARAANNAGIWVVDGGEVRFVTSNPGGAFGTRIYDAASGVFLALHNPFGDSEILFSDGTPSGTVSLHRFSRSRLRDQGLGEGVTVGDTLYLVVDDTRSGKEIWSVDRASGGIVNFEMLPGSDSPDPTELTRWNGVVAFTTIDDLGRLHIWAVSPELGEPTAVTGLGLESGFFVLDQRRPALLLPLGDRLLYSGGDELIGLELLQTDLTGLAAGTVANIAPDVASGNPSRFVATADRVYFVASPTRELWMSDGSTAGTTTLPGPVMRSPDSLGQFGDPLGVEIDGRVVFEADDPAGNTAIWRSDGTEAGTSIVVQDGWAVGTLIRVGALAYFIRRNDAGEPELWGTDGTTGGSERLMPLPAVELTLIAGNETVFFTAREMYSNTSVLHAAKLAAGRSEPLRSFVQHGLGAPTPASFRPLGPGLVFSAGEFEYGEELWITDGTAEGTRMVADINPSRTALPNGSIFGESSFPHDITVVGDRCFFFADDGEHGFELWSSDGTQAGTQLVRDIVPGPGTPVLSSNPLYLVLSTPAEMIAAGGRVFFAADDGVHGNEVWTSDGSEGGTFLLRDIMPGPRGSNPTALSAVDGALVFSACDDLGCEMWTSDGTEAGTVMLADVAPGPPPSNPSEFIAAGDVVFFSARDEKGIELWGLPRDALPSPAPIVSRPTPTVAPTSAPRPCDGDCNNDRTVSIAELVRGVSIALGSQQIDSCPSLDIDRNGRIGVNELIAAVNRALRGCV